MIATVLRRRLMFAPMLLSTVLKNFDGLEHRFRFDKLVREYLPEERERLNGMLPTDAARRFVELFSKRYFTIHLPEGSTGTYDNTTGRWRYDGPVAALVKAIPLKWEGLEEYHYDSVWNASPAHLLASALCECPFPSRPGARVVVVDYFRKRAPVKGLPPKGYLLERLEGALIDSAYPGLLAWCRWLFGRTGNRWLDTSKIAVLWTRKNVDDLARDWPLYLETDKQMKEFNTWLKKDLPGRSAEVVTYVNEHVKMLLMEVFGGENDNRTTIE